MADYITATYRFQSPDKPLTEADVQALADKIAIGQTLGTAQPEVLSKLANYVGRGHSVLLEDVHTAQFKVDYPTPEVIPADIAMLLSITFGKVSMLGQLQLVDLALPDSFANQFNGPRFGVEGIRDCLGVSAQPLLMSIFKPCVGLSADELARMIETQAEAGCHLVMDDELLADATVDSALRRVEACRKVLDKVEAQTGHKLLYATHLTGAAHELHDRAKQLINAGTKAFLFSYLCYGLPLLASLTQDADINVPFLGHPALAGAYYGLPGIAQPLLFGLLPRLAGCDIVLSPSPEGNIQLSRETVAQTLSHLRKPIAHLKPSLAAPSAGIKASMVPALLKAYGSNVIINAGTGVYEHVESPQAGVHEFLAAIETHSKTMVSA